MMRLLPVFLINSFRYSLRGSLLYVCWMGFLSILMMIGIGAYIAQLKFGLVVTGMTDHVSWGFYISNFTFLVGLAAAAVMLLLPAYIFGDIDFSRAALFGEGVAVSAITMCLAFVTVDLGSPERAWHLIPMIGYFNWPQSLLAWDVLVLNGYFILNIGIPLYILTHHYYGMVPKKRKYVPFVMLSIFWALTVHLVTAFLYAGLPARPFWNSGLMGPRFLASAFAAGPAFILILLGLINRLTSFKVRDALFDKLALVVTTAAQINLIMLVSEIFKEFYSPTEHSQSAQYLFFGLHGHAGLVVWIWTSIIMNILTTIVISIHPLRRNRIILNSACFILFIAIWMEKGMGLVIPGFIPSPLGEIVEYWPSKIEILVTIAIWALGFFVLTPLVRVAVAIETGQLRFKQEEGGRHLAANTPHND